MRNTFNKIPAWMSLKALLTLAALSGAVALFSSCDEEENPAPPSVTLSQESFSGPAGTDAGITVTIVAPAGAKTLTVLKNGVAFATQEFSGEKDAEYEFYYIIENLAIGTSTNFTFELTDKKDQVSNTGTYTVTVAAKTIINKSGVISASETWTAGNIYRLQGYVRVGDDATRLNGATTITGVTLTIEPGTIIIGERSSKGTLIIHRGNKIIAEGTESNPIVFTSEREQGSRAAGDWGGVVICGKAANNQGTDVQLEGGYGAYHGGSTDDDNSGILKYVRIEYAGVPINPNQEVNSLTLGSPGSGTVISYVMCSHGLDDAFEWFGGTANADHLIAYKGFDDDFDVDFGFRGTVQFAIAIREPNSADQSGSNGFEVDNDGNSSANTPFTSATFSNISIIGPKATNETAISAQFQNAAHLRRNNKIKIYNSFFTGYPNGIFIDGAGTVTNAGSGDLVLKKNVLAGVNNWGGNGFGSTTNTDESTNVTGLPFGTNANHATVPRGFWMATTATIGGNTPLVWFKANNEVYSKWTDVGVSSNIFAANFGANSPTLLPTAGSALLTGADFTGLTGLQTVTYRGAFGTTDWTTGWANWNPQTSAYQ
jgi:hypothetical protein